MAQAAGVVAQEASSEARAVDRQAKAAAVRNWINKPGLPAHQIGKEWVVRRSDLDAWLASRPGSRNPGSPGSPSA